MPSEVAKRTLERLATLKQRGASPDALLFTAQLFGGKMTNAKDDWVCFLDWSNAELLFRPESLRVWDAAVCRQNRFLKIALGALLANDEDGSFRRQLRLGFSDRQVDPVVKALLIVWSADHCGYPEALWGDYRSLGYGLDAVVSPSDEGLVEWVERYLHLASDSPAVSALLPAGNPEMEEIIKGDGVYGGSRNLAALVLCKMSRGLLLWLCRHECFRTLRFVVETHPMADLPLAYADILLNASKAFRRHRGDDNHVGFGEFVKALELHSPGFLAAHVDAYGNTLLWTALHPAMRGIWAREIALARCKILRESGCLSQKSNGDGISWDCIENEIRLCRLK